MKPVLHRKPPEGTIHLSANYDSLGMGTILSNETHDITDEFEAVIAKMPSEMISEVLRKHNSDVVIVSKSLLKIMIAEFWDVDNNATCAGATILFLRKIGFTPREVSNAVDNAFRVTQDRLNEIEGEVKEQLAYYKE